MTTLIEYDAAYLNECVRVFVRTFRAEPFGYGWLTEDAAGRYFAGIARYPGFLGYILLEDGAAAGACLGHVDDYFQGAVYEIKEIFLAPEAQNRGLGAKFMSGIEKDLTKRDVSCITLLTQRELKAHGFYLRLGYAESTGAALMVKSL